MTAGSLRGDLLDIPGIEGAEIEGDSLSPAGVKVRLAPGADAALVSEQVRRVLAAHGLSSELDPSQAGPAVAERILAPAPEPIDDVGEDGGDDGGEWDVTFDEPPEAVIEAEADEAEAQLESSRPIAVEQEAQPGPAAPGGLASISVEEDRNGVSVVATSGDGRRASRPARPEGRGLEEAVIAAVAALFSLPTPTVVALDDRAVDGSTVLTVVIDVDEQRVAGSTIVDGGRPYAVGRAAWAALSAR